MAQVSTTTVVQLITSGAPINNERFQGWFSNSDSSSWEDINCPTSSSLITTGNYAQCCSFGATTCSTMWTSCDGNVAVGISSNSCEYCGSMSIYGQYPAADQTPVTEIVCGNRWLASTIYRRIVVSSTATSIVTLSSNSATDVTSTPTDTTPTDPTSIVSSESSGTTPTAAFPSNTNQLSSTTPTASASSAADQTPGIGDNALIASAVVGPIVAISLIALALWFFYFRKRQRTKANENTEAPAPHYVYYNEVSGAHHIDSESQPPKYYQTHSYEMSANTDRMHELPGDSGRRE